jgi:hypothetical protein
MGSAMCGICIILVGWIRNIPAQFMSIATLTGFTGYGDHFLGSDFLFPCSHVVQVELTGSMVNSGYLRNVNAIGMSEVIK